LRKLSGFNCLMAGSYDFCNRCVGTTEVYVMLFNVLLLTDFLHTETLHKHDKALTQRLKTCSTDTSLYRMQENIRVSFNTILTVRYSDTIFISRPAIQKTKLKETVN
jgi:hypothetical protein